MDDTAITVTGNDFTETHNKLSNIMNRTNGILEWVKKHNCTLSNKKFQLLDLSRRLVLHQFNRHKRIPLPRRALNLGNQ